VSDITSTSHENEIELGGLSKEWPIEKETGTRYQTYLKYMNAFFILVLCVICNALKMFGNRFVPAVNEL
jgi:hypothetical protein